MKMRSGKFVSMTIFASHTEIVLPWKLLKFLCSRFRKTREKAGVPLREPSPFPKRQSFFPLICSSYKKAYEGLLYVCCKNQNHLRSKSFWKTKVSETYTKKKHFFIFLNIMLYYDVVYVYYKNQSCPKWGVSENPKLFKTAEKNICFVLFCHKDMSCVCIL